MQPYLLSSLQLSLLSLHTHPFSLSFCQIAPMKSAHGNQNTLGREFQTDPPPHSISHHLPWLIGACYSTCPQKPNELRICQ